MCHMLNKGIVGDGEWEMPFTLDMIMSGEEKNLLDRARQPSGGTGVILHVQDYKVKEDTSHVVRACYLTRDRDVVLQEQRALMAQRFLEMRAARAARALPLLTLLELILRKRAHARSRWSATRAVGGLAKCPTSVRARVMAFVTGDVYRCVNRTRGSG